MENVTNEKANKKGQYDVYHIDLTLMYSAERLVLNRIEEIKLRFHSDNYSTNNI